MFILIDNFEECTKHENNRLRVVDIRKKTATRAYLADGVRGGRPVRVVQRGAQIRPGSRHDRRDYGSREGATECAAQRSL